MNKKFNILKIFKKNHSLNIACDHVELLFKDIKIESEMNHSIEQRIINDNIFEISLIITINARNLETKENCYTITTSYGGLFEVAGINKEELEQIKLTHCPSIIYPYCRTSISQILSDSVFPPLTIPITDFFAIHSNKSKSN